MGGVFSDLILVGRLALAAVPIAARVLVLGEGHLSGDSHEEYSELGKLLVAIAAARTVAPDADAGDSRVEDLISGRLEERTGHRFGRREIRDYLRGSRLPPPQFIPAFADTYSLTVKERRRVAWAHAFSEPPHPRTLEYPPPVGKDGE